MPVRTQRTHDRPAGRLRDRLGAQSGFTMILALGVLAVTALLTAAVLLTVRSDATLTRGELDGKRAYAAAQAGLQAYLYGLNVNAASATWWETCSNDTVARTAVPGTTTGSTYSYTPVTTCSASDPVGSLIDTGTGTLRMKFTGYSGAACPAASPACQTRTIVASFRTLSPLSFLWYTVHETVDTTIGGSGCATFYYSGSGPPSSCRIVWVTGDTMAGPMYTWDQLLINPGASPTFGRSARDQLASQVPTSKASDICVSSNCQGAHIVGSPVPNVTPQVPLPSDNSNLLTDATSHGKVYSGTTTLTVSGTTATGWNCPSSSSCTALSINLVSFPIIYVSNAAGCSSTYDPANVSYPTSSGHYYGPCGDMYISGSYSTPLTVAAVNNVVLTSSLTNSTDPTGATGPTGLATVGLVANQYVRVMHTCTGNPNVTIDAAILTLAHSFFVDNYDCGGTPQGTLTVHGAIAQYFRGIVGQVNSSGYLKNYIYDNRLALIVPPYLFDLQNTQWVVFRETLCSPTAPAATSPSCSYTGS
jgi:Tfp pilus assembly protein PilX